MKAAYNCNWAYKGITTWQELYVTLDSKTILLYMTFNIWFYLYFMKF